MQTAPKKPVQEAGKVQFWYKNTKSGFVNITTQHSTL